MTNHLPPAEGQRFMASSHYKSGLSEFCSLRVHAYSTQRLGIMYLSRIACNPLITHFESLWISNAYTCMHPLLSNVQQSSEAPRLGILPYHLKSHFGTANHRRL